MFKIGLWGKNLLNEHYNVYSAQSTTGDNIAYARPRSYGAMASLKF
jgi:iron complex outermembrane receptor protein